MLCGLVIALVKSCMAFEGGDGDDWISGPCGGVKRVRLNRQTPHHLVRHGILGIQSRPRVGKRLRVQDHSGRNHAGAKARRVHQDDEAYVPCARQDWGWLGLSGACAGPRLQAVHDF